MIFYPGFSALFSIWFLFLGQPKAPVGELNIFPDLLQGPRINTGGAGYLFIAQPMFPGANKPVNVGAVFTAKLFFIDLILRHDHHLLSLFWPEKQCKNFSICSLFSAARDVIIMKKKRIEFFMTEESRVFI
jgi:hypothetical protein